MKVLLCFMFTSFCVASGHSKLQVYINSPIENCPDFDEAKLKIILAELKFNQNSDDDFTLDGKYTITDSIDGPISIKITSKKYERGTWVNSMLNQNIRDICKEMEKENGQEWLKLFDEWTVNRKCPFIKKIGEFNDLRIYNSKTSSEMLPPNFYGQYKTESRFYGTVNGEKIELGCYIVDFELASV